MHRILDSTFGVRNIVYNGSVVVFVKHCASCRCQFMLTYSVCFSCGLAATSLEREGGVKRSYCFTLHI